MASHPKTHAQFAHLYAAASRPAKSGRGKDKKWSVTQLLAEADRVPGNFAHVPNPLPPHWLKGSRQAVAARTAEWRAQAREAGGKACLRVTSPSLACAVVSWPRARESEWASYRDSVIGHFEATFGTDRIPGIVEHLDESHQHIHVYFVPRDGEGFGAVHPGYAARVRARMSPGNHVRRDYKKAMTKWQDDLYAATGEPHGLARVGPKRERLSRVDHVAHKRALEVRAQAEDEAAQLLARAQETARQASARLASVRKAERDLMEKVRVVQHAQDRLAQTPAGAMEAQLRARDAELERVRGEVARLAAELDAERFRNRERDKQVTPMKLRPPTPLK